MRILIRGFIIIVLCLMDLVFLSAQTKFKLWEEHPATGKMKFTELTSYLADKNKNTGISVILCPGGSYCYLGMNIEGHNVAHWLNEHGINAFVLRYRIGIWGNHHPAMIQDLQQTIQWVREHSREYGISPERIGVMGFSAGGHLAGTAGIYYNRNFMEPLGFHPKVSLRPDFVAMIYPVVSMEDSLAHRRSRSNLLGSDKKKREMIQMMSLEQNVHSGMPPVFLVACVDDKTVNYRNSVCFDDQMKQKKLPCSFHLYQHGGHGFGVNEKKSGEEASLWKNEFLKWVNDLYK
jgi:Esterase/lipase